MLALMEGRPCLKFSASCFRAAVCLLNIVVSGLVGVGLRREWARSETACVAAYSEEIIGNGRVSGKKSVVSDTCSLVVLGM